MKKIIWSLVVLVVIVVALFLSPVYKLAVIKTADYQWQRFVEKSIAETKQGFDTAEYFSVDPRNLMANLRVNTFENSIRPAFEKNQAWNVLYCAYTLPHWDFYKISRIYEEPLVKMRTAMMNAAKTYFAEPKNLRSFYEKHHEEIIDSYAKLSPKRKAEFMSALISTEKVFSNILNDEAILDGMPADSFGYNETYLAEYALRRLKEGGKPLVECYRDIAVEIRTKVENTTISQL